MGQFLRLEWIKTWKSVIISDEILTHLCPGGFWQLSLELIQFLCSAFYGAMLGEVMTSSSENLGLRAKKLSAQANQTKIKSYQLRVTFNGTLIPSVLILVWKNFAMNMPTFWSNSFVKFMISLSWRLKGVHQHIGISPELSSFPVELVNVLVILSDELLCNKIEQKNPITSQQCKLIQSRFFRQFCAWISKSPKSLKHVGEKQCTGWIHKYVRETHRFIGHEKTSGYIRGNKEDKLWNNRWRFMTRVEQNDHGYGESGAVKNIWGQVARKNKNKNVFKKLINLEADGPMLYSIKPTAVGISWR